MFYVGHKYMLFEVTEELAAKYVTAFNDSTEWTGVETWVRPATFFMFVDRFADWHKPSSRVADVTWS